MENLLKQQEFTVLLVEDEAVTRGQLSRMIASRGYRVLEAENGQEGLEVFRSASVDIVLSDVMMPVMDGLEMSRIIRTECRTAEIIILTAFNDTDHLLAAIEIGISHFLFKPLRADNLFAVLEASCGMVQMQRQLRKQDEQIRMLSNALEQSASIAIITDRHGNIEYVNRKFCEVTGYSADEAIGQTPRLLKSGRTSTKTYQALWQSVLNGKEWHGTLLNRKKSGDFYWEYCSISPLFLADGQISKYIKTAEDITERLKLEKAAQQARQLEALGILAGGMAHDFNNLLQVILGSLSLALQRSEPGSELHELLGMAEQSSEEARTLSRKLLELVRESESARCPVSLASVVESGIESALAGTSVVPALELPNNLPLVYGDEHQLRQVMYQLGKNAAEAMPSGGTLRIAARHVLTSPDQSLLPHGDYVQVIVSDTGYGIAPEKLDRVFEPYFTTKQMGNTKGQGLGLAICHSVIGKHGGCITVESEKGNGATFTIWLPVAPE